MSTAIMPHNAMYEFGESFIKTGAGADTTTLSGHHHHHAGAGVRLSLARMQSSPGGGGAAAAAAAAANAGIAALLGNLTQHHHHQQQQQQHRRLERTHSAPASSLQQQQPPSAASITAATTVNTSRYKTELCRPFEEFGVCKYGDKCQFAHGMNELRSLARHPKYKTELCRTYHTVGFCPYGPRCHFVHNQDEIMQKAPPTSPTAILPPRSGVAVTNRLRPTALSPALSIESSSPPCSLSQSPTSSMGSFFSSEPELHSPNAEDQRLPVFNRISTTPILSLNELILQ